MLGDAEVLSDLHGDASSAFPFNGYGEDFRMRRKRLTPHWRTFIRPLMWRCKWVELQIKNFESQALKYDGELAEFNRRKLFELDNCSLEVILAEKSINVNDEFGVNDELLSHEFRDGDNSLEQILLKLGILQSQISKIKSRLHKDFFGDSILWLTPAVIEQTRHLTAFPGICRLVGSHSSFGYANDTARKDFWCKKLILICILC
ncbi:uncharacterized protein LOC114310516 isoform X2 [Camellia sinensis]|uniref:uncharacterized protein LOC114310516 isoform X2 n=1 Tax=Camellia sinensis TaxID=4442 RepID=UPI00103660F1|nr:uncharacterized protein LOC114310516 isoform X2 [Camellia sinensis]